MGLAGLLLFDPPIPSPREHQFDESLRGAGDVLGELDQRLAAAVSEPIISAADTVSELDSRIGHEIIRTTEGAGRALKRLDSRVRDFVTAQLAAADAVLPPGHGAGPLGERGEEVGDTTGPVTADGETTLVTPSPGDGATVPIPPILPGPSLPPLILPPIPVPIFPPPTNGQPTPAQPQSTPVQPVSQVVQWVIPQPLIIKHLIDWDHAGRVVLAVLQQCGLCGQPQEPAAGSLRIVPPIPSAAAVAALGGAGAAAAGVTP